RTGRTSPWRGQADSGVALSPRYAHADSNPPLVSVFWRPQDAQAEINRVCSLYAQARAFYQVRLIDLDLAPKPGQVCRLTYPRYCREAGRPGLVRYGERNQGTGEGAMDQWGGS